MLKNIKNNIKYLRGSMSNLLPRSLSHKIYYFIVMHKRLYLKGNMDFNKKIHYMCINDYGKYQSNNSDKLLAREAVAM